MVEGQVQLSKHQQKRDGEEKVKLSKHPQNEKKQSREVSQTRLDICHDF